MDVHVVQFGGGARGDVCLNGRGLRPLSGHPRHMDLEQASESDFTKFWFQDMTQYPEKSDQWDAR